MGRQPAVILTWHNALRSIAVIVALCSAVLTGIFFATFGGESWALIVIYFVIFFLISLLCPILVNMTSAKFIENRIGHAFMLLPFCAFFIVVDLVSNAGVSALFRESELTRADNQNVVADNARKDVKRIQTRIAEIRRRTAWQTDYLAPASYDAEIARLRSETENGRNIWQRSGECQNATVGSSQRVCQAISTAQANKQNAINRQALKAEMKELESELRDAKVRVVDTPTTASAALAHAENVAAGMTGQIDPDSTSTFWANYGLSMLSGVAVTLGSIASSIALAFSSASVAVAPTGRRDDDSPWVQQRQVEYQHHGHYAPIPLPATSHSQMAVTQNTVHHDHTDDSLKAMIETLDRINMKYGPKGEPAE